MQGYKDHENIFCDYCTSPLSGMKVLGKKYRSINSLYKEILQIGESFKGKKPESADYLSADRN